MKKLVSVFMIMLLLVGCNAKTQNDKEIHVGVAFYPMKDLLLLIEDDLKDVGYELFIHEFSDYQTPNNLLNNQELDANMIQHDYFLQAFNKANNATLETVLPIYHATFALYSKDYTDLNDLPKGATITLPDDATNLSRSLYLLEQSGLIALKEGSVAPLTLDDVLLNPKELNFEDQVPLTSLAQRYNETRLAVMYPTYAKSLELAGDAERLFVEKQDSVTEGYAISMVSRSEDKDGDKIRALISVLKSEKVRDYLLENYDWASIPAF